MTSSKKLNRTSLHARVNATTPGNLREMAKILGMTYTTKDGRVEGATGKLLDAIAQSPFLIPILKRIYSEGG